MKEIKVSEHKKPTWFFLYSMRLIGSLLFLIVCLYKNFSIELKICMSLLAVACTILAAWRIFQIIYPLLRFSQEKICWMGGFARWEDIQTIQTYTETSDLHVELIRNQGTQIIVLTAKPGHYFKNWGFRSIEKHIDLRLFCNDEEINKIVQQLEKQLTNYHF